MERTPSWKKFCFALVAANALLMGLFFTGIYWLHLEDVKAAEVTRNSTELADLRAEIWAHRVSAKTPFTSRERAAAYNALRSIRKLRAATAIGLSLGEYSNRVLDTGIEIDAALRWTRDCPAKLEIQSALDCYSDASNLWSNSIGKDTIADFEIADKRSRLSGYGIPETLSHSKEANIYLEKFDEHDRDLVLQTVWSKAGEHLLKAEREVLTSLDERDEKK